MQDTDSTSKVDAVKALLQQEDKAARSFRIVGDKMHTVCPTLWRFKNPLHCVTQEA